MKTLAKIHKEEIEIMISNKEKLSHIKAYCKGADFDTDNYSSPVHISENGKITITYRRLKSYYYIQL